MPVDDGHGEEDDDEGIDTDYHETDEEAGTQYALDVYDETEFRTSVSKDTGFSTVTVVMPHPHPHPPAVTGVTLPGSVTDLIESNLLIFYVSCSLTGCLLVAGTCTLCMVCCKRRRRAAQMQQPADAEAGPSGRYHAAPAPPPSIFPETPKPSTSNPSGFHHTYPTPHKREPLFAVNTSSSEEEIINLQKTSTFSTSKKDNRKNLRKNK